ncbi:unnamed protein product, partial [Staurois parvus]
MLLPGPNLPWAPIPPPHAAARSRVSHGSLYGLHCCCLHRHTLPCATFRSPHTLLVCSIFCHRVLADYGPPIAAARPVICHGPPYRLVTLLLGPQCDMGPCTASHCSHSAMCHFQVSSHSCWFPFCHRLLADYSPPIGAAR